jgi:hypothetical protein
MQLTGKIKVIKPIQQVSDKFKKQELVLTTDGQYPDDILVEFQQDKCTILDKYKIGQAVTISINIKGREWINPQGEAKYFNTIVGWRIENSVNETPVNVAEFVPPTQNTNLPY